MLGALEAALRTALSGGVTGAAIGGGARFLSGGNKKQILKSALVSSGLGAGLAGGSQLVGSSLLGDPEEEEGGSPYTVRGALGGAVGGGSLGALLGLLAASGKLPKMSIYAPQKLRSIVGSIKEELPLRNFLTKEIEKISKNPTAKGIRKAGIYGAGMGAIPGAFLGADEGQTVDTILREYEMQKMKDSYGY